jgi:hypothetical protein
MLPAVDSPMEWTLRLVEAGIDGQSRSFEVMAISRPDGIGDIANLDLTLVEAKQLPAHVQQEVAAAQTRRLPVELLNQGNAASSPNKNAVILKKSSLNHSITAKRFSPTSFIIYRNGGRIRPCSTRSYPCGLSLTHLIGRSSAAACSSTHCRASSGEEQSCVAGARPRKSLRAPGAAPSPTKAATNSWSLRVSIQASSLPPSSLPLRGMVPVVPL